MVLITINIGSINTEYKETKWLTENAHVDMDVSEINIPVRMNIIFPADRDQEAVDILSRLVFPTTNGS